MAAGFLGVRGRQGALGAEARAPRGAEGVVFQLEPMKMLFSDEAVMGGRSH